ncbi:Fe2+-dependent dioxygenase [Fischerella thermalis CCMEE 5198]|jgi:PKHD-type hydroxylase|uniref:Fe2+-dependent dioxygenase n=1 Tax=Fischerella thermalis TaxID=372787 RepID=UPI000C806C03|nr:Fe2+-dependent dioxygenase [Fischerella thermalis]PMB06117.1 Fe2+-dependent dioxygenase [Fischerella thermalis CCMEE 5196]PMB25615.1 Fe2+-dependent dioxygenase [Fischerella thermalis CCMEE 5198]
MILCIDGVLDSADLIELHQILQQGQFLDGKLTAGTYAKVVKENEQWQSEAGAKQQAQTLVLTALQRHPLFQSVAQPRSICPILFSRYQSGMSYGVHMDNALMGEGATLTRTDISLTLFLSDPATYTGGELAIDTSLGEQTFKLAAGSMVVYPSTFLHHVTPVTEGVRLAAVTWVQSLIRNPSEREMLFELDTVRQALFEKYGKTVEFDLLCKLHSNLLRKWVEL